MHAPKDPFSLPPHQCDWSESTSEDSSGFAVVDNVVDLSWLDHECSTEQNDLSEHHTQANAGFGSLDDVDQTQVDLDLGGAVEAILARVHLEKRSLRPSHRPPSGPGRRPAFERRQRLDESRLAVIEELPLYAERGEGLRERTQCADLLVIDEVFADEVSDLGFDIEVSCPDPAEIALVLGSPLAPPRLDYEAVLEIEELEEIDPRFLIEL